MKLETKIKLKKVNRLLDERGLGARHEVQAIVDNEVLKYNAKYIPWQSGALNRSAITGTGSGSGLIIYNSPYGKYVYYGLLMVAPNGSSWAKFGEKKHIKVPHQPLTYDGAPARGAYFFEKMKHYHLNSILDKAAAAAGARGEL